jgi:peptide alpha-N-acetyltransferase
MDRDEGATSSQLGTAAVIYRQYTGEADLQYIMDLVQSELSEPYVIYTFRYFLHQWYVQAMSFDHLLSSITGHISPSS